MSDATKQPFWKKEIGLSRKAECTERQGAERDAAKAKREKPVRAKRAKGGSDAQRIVGLKIGASQLAAATLSNNGAAELLQVARHDLDAGHRRRRRAARAREAERGAAGVLRQEHAAEAATCASASRTTASASARSTSRASTIRHSSTTPFASARRRRCRFRSTTPCSTTTSSARRPITPART